MHTTLRLLRERNACSDRYAHLKRALGDYGDDTPISLVRILETNGVDDAAWALRAVPPKQAAERDRRARWFACVCVRGTPLRYGQTTWVLLTDERSRRAVEVAEQYAEGRASTDELAAAGAAARDATWDAAGAAAWAAAKAAAGAAAWAAAGDAAWAAAGAAARDAAWDAAWNAAGAAASAWQADAFRAVFGEA